VRDLALLVPSRGRPARLSRLWESVKATATASTTLIAGLDEDDPTRDGYPPGPVYVTEPGLRYVTAWVNRLAALYADGFAVLGTVGDDNVCETPGWDSAIVAALERNPFAFGNDLYPLRAPGTLACHIFMRRATYRALGYFGPPELTHMYVDVAWMAWGVSCGISYLDDVHIRHEHYTTGRAACDETYARSAARTAADLAAWHAYSRREGPGGLNADIARLGGEPFTASRLADFNQTLAIPAVWPL